MTDPDTLYTLCEVTDCPFFVEENPSYGDYPGLAEYVHLTRGDEADDARDDHDAVPGMTASLAHWQASGPERVRERFTE